MTNYKSLIINPDFMSNMKKYALGIDIGGTGTKFGVVNEEGEVLCSSSIPTQQYPIIDEYCNVLCEEMKKLVASQGLQMSDIVGVGCGAPDANYYSGCIEHATNLPWKGVVPLAKLITECMGVKCTVTNDANAAAQGEMIYGSARGMKNFIVITLGTGVGSGIVIDGKLLYGNDGFAGELGHCKIDHSGAGRMCGCGQKGCIEAYASATAIIRDTKRAMINNRNSKLWEIGSIDAVNGKTAFDYYETDADAKAVVDSYIEHLACGITNYANVFRPEAIVLGGGVCAQGDALIKPLKKILDEDIFAKGLGPKVELLIAKLGNDAGSLGAAALVI
jgi:glucokinase